MRLLAAALLCCVAAPAWAFAPCADQCAVNVRFAGPSRDMLFIEGETYVVSLDCVMPRVLAFEVQGKNLLAGDGLQPDLNGKPIEGPGRVNIYSFGTQMYEVHLRDLKQQGVDADIELALYCYAKRVFANLNVTPRGAPAEMTLGWNVAVRQRIVAVETDDPEQSATPFVFETGLKCAAFADPLGLPEANRTQIERSARMVWARKASKHPASAPGTRGDAVMLCAARNEEALMRLLHVEMFPHRVVFQVEGGTFDGYQSCKGFYQVTTETRGPRGFEEAWINPNQRYEVALDVRAPEDPVFESGPAEVICNVRNAYSVLEAAVLTDAHGFPLPVQVQVSKNFGGEKEEGAAEGDAPYSEAYVPLRLDAHEPFKGRVYHLFGNWGPHPLKQISSIRFHHHYFHASLGPTETFCYVPFEFPREDGGNYILADVRGLTNLMWPDQPQHDHVSVVGATRYRSGGAWVNNVLEDTRIYLTAPNMASFAMDYRGASGKTRTRLECFELPQTDEARCFIKMDFEVLEPVVFDASSARDLRFLNIGAYIVRTVWPRLAYTNAEGETAQVDVPAADAWVLEAEPLAAQHAIVAAYPHRHGNMGLFIHHVEGQLGGRPMDRFGVSCFGGKNVTEVFLTAPEALTKLVPGDGFTARLFVMPYGGGDSSHAPVERQRTLYGAKGMTVNALHGEVLSDFPAVVDADPRGFAEFETHHGSNWMPLIVQGFASHKAPMLWEKRAGQWLLHDQQIHGNDWHQSFRAQDGSTGYVFAVHFRPDQHRHFLVASAPNATAVTQRNGFVTVEGGPIEFVSPVEFEDVVCEPLEGAELFLCAGAADIATSK